MRISEQMIAQQRGMTFDQRDRHEVAGGVVEVDVPEAVEEGIVARAKIIKGAGRSIERMGR